MVPLISYLPATRSLGERVGLNEYSCPHFGQTPSSLLSAASHDEHRRLRSGTTPGTSAASGSCGGSAARASGREPIARDEPVRTLPERPERVERVLRPLRVEGVRPDPVRAEETVEPVRAV